MIVTNQDIHQVIDSNEALERIITELKDTREEVYFDTYVLRELLIELQACRQEIKRLRSK